MYMNTVNNTSTNAWMLFMQVRWSVLVTSYLKKYLMPYKKFQLVYLATLSTKPFSISAPLKLVIS